MATFNNARTRATLFLIKKALFELLAEHSISEINVKAICQKAEINRSTFYLHYKDIDELLKTIQKEEIQKFCKNTLAVTNTESLRSMTMRYFTYIKENDNVFRILLSGKFPDFEKSFIQALLSINQLTVDPYVNIFSIAGHLYITRLWIENSYKESIEEMTDKVTILYNQLSVK